MDFIRDGFCQYLTQHVTPDAAARREYVNLAAGFGVFWLIVHALTLSAAILA